MSTQRRSHHKTHGRRRERNSDLPTTITLPHSLGRPVAVSPSSRSNKKLAATLVLSFCIVSIFELGKILDTTNVNSSRRSLLSNLYLSAHSTLVPWAHHYLADVVETPDPSRETALFWHIPKSGGTTAKRLYQCMGQTLAHRVGADPRFGHDKDSEIVVFEPHEGKDWKVVNVDTTIKAGINKAKKMGLVKSHTADLIFTMEPAYAGEMLYDEENKGRYLALFRHPVDRALSMFFYLQSATWERTYRPEWANMTVLEWANLPNSEKDYMVHKLVNKKFDEPVTDTDLIIAKELVRQRFIVGLMGEMAESIRRFNIVLGMKESKKRNQECMAEFFGPKEEKPVVATEGGEKTLATTDKSNSNKHPKFDEGSPEYDTIAALNPLDMILYQYIEKLFDEQKEIIDHYFDQDVKSEQDVISKEDAPEVDDYSEDAISPELQRSLSLVNVSIPAEIENNLVDITVPFRRSNSETPFFWHVPKCGGTTLQRMYWCMGMSIANEVGGNPKFEAALDRSKLIAFKPWTGNPGKVVNVDVSTHQGIMDAHRRGFLGDAEQAELDLISTSEFNFAYSMLLSPQHKGRMFALFRNPIERAVSKFFYLRKATWEPTYNTHWKTMTLGEWASRDRGDNNWMVRKLIGKDPQATLNSEDLQLAMQIIRTKFVIGLKDRYLESVHRFNSFLGVDMSNTRNQGCIDEFTNYEKSSKLGEKNEVNSYEHPEARRGSRVWKSLGQINSYDVALYKFITEEYGKQATLFNFTQIK